MSISFRLSVTALVLAALLAIAPQARAEEPRHHLEIGIFGGLAKSAQPLGNRDIITYRNGGSELALFAVYKTPYFLSPFIDLSYMPIAELHARVDLGPYGGATTTAGRSWAYGMMAGFAYDAWRFRFRAGVGYYDLFSKARVLKTRALSNEIDFGYLLAVNASLLKREHIQIGAEIRASFIIEGQIAVVALGPSISGDAISF